MKAPCAFTASTNHSNDRKEVWHGKATPTILCGYHASEAWLHHVLNNLPRGGPHDQ